jgi:hypothetical protein
MRRAAGRCLGLGGIFLVTLVIAAGLTGILLALNEKLVSRVMLVVTAIALLAFLVDLVVLLVLVGMDTAGLGKDGRETVSTEEKGD